LYKSNFNPFVGFFFDGIGRVEDEIDKVIEKLAILELIISQDKDEDFDINSYLEEFKEMNQEDVNSMKKGLYMEFSGEIISRLDS